MLNRLGNLNRYSDLKLNRQGNLNRYSNYLKRDYKNNGRGDVPLPFFLSSGHFIFRIQDWMVSLLFIDAH